jgi:hypothetical protein
MKIKIDRNFSAIIRLSLWIAASSLWFCSACQADTPTPEELCRQRNAASCEINGLKFFIEDNCPKGAKVLRAKGKERCENLTENFKADNKIQVIAESRKLEPLPQSNANDLSGEESANFFDSPYFYLLIIGLFQGLINRAGLGPLIIMIVVMPLLSTWVIMYGIQLQPVESLYWVLLKTILYGMGGWVIGAVARFGLLKYL